MSTETGAQAWPVKELDGWLPTTASIIIDNYNYAAFLGEAIESALNQTHDAQVIVVDDGSKDNSRDVIAAYGKRVEAIYKENGGQASAFNAGFRRASGDVIFFLDSDDMLEPGTVEAVLNAWREGTVMVHHPMLIIDSKGRPWGEIPDPNLGLADGDVRSLLLNEGTYPTTVTSGLAFARPALAKVMPMPEKDFIYSADGYLVHALPFFGRVQRVNGRLGKYRTHGGNATDAWSDPGGYAAGFRRKISYSLNEIETVRKFAREFSLTPSADIGEGDPDFLGYRLFSIILDPRSHPIPHDRKFGLLFKYIARRWKSSWSLRRRVSTIIFPLFAAFASPSAAAKLIHTMSDSAAQPEWLSALSKWLRRRQKKGAATAA